MSTATPLPDRNLEVKGNGEGVPPGLSITELQRLRIRIQGMVQGVGFRPFVHRLAEEMHLAGRVWNGSEGVFMEVEGPRSTLELFLDRIREESPPHSRIQSIDTQNQPPQGISGFSIDPSEQGEKTALIPPDLTVCPDCLREMFDPSDRRFRYPFTNCTHCGPRYSILNDLPYDRCHTSMSGFMMCEECRAEYEDPLNRRFHAQPNACPLCGPQLSLWDSSGVVLAEKDEALRGAEEAIRAGRIVALKGLGGFHLIVDARNEEAVKALRKRKHREEKPLAVMFPDMDRIRKACKVDEIEESLLLSAEAPIVLLKKLEGDSVGEKCCAKRVAPHNPYLGVILPYTPLHHLLLKDLYFPVVATSGNLSDEPICIDEKEAVSRLRGIANLFLVHNRPIVRQVDDSIVRVMAGREMIIRRSRGYAPLPIFLRTPVAPTLAVGAHFKNTIAAGIGNQAYLSQHIGDLETILSYQAFEKTLKTFNQLKDFKPQSVAHDLHPDYLSTSFARSSKLRRKGVQHHCAHIYSCMAEQGVEPPLLGVAWDGTGLGTDGTIWGGEFLRIDSGGGFDRIAHLRTFRLPGGDTAAREPRRSALGLLSSAVEIPRSLWMNLLFVKSFGDRGLSILDQMLSKRLNAHLTSSMGRLFDAISAILGQRFLSKFEGQAAMELEFLAGEARTVEPYPVGIEKFKDRKGWMVNWGPMILAILEECGKGRSAPEISLQFHNTLAESVVRVAERVGESKVVLSGGCFQNRVLSELVIKRLTEQGFVPIWHRQVPPNDGGVSLGQLIATNWEGRYEPCV